MARNLSATTSVTLLDTDVSSVRIYSDIYNTVIHSDIHYSNLVFSDVLLGSFIKYNALSDDFYSADVITFNYSKGLSDISSVAEALSLSTAKTINESFGSTDTPIVNVGKNVSESSNITDVATVTPTKVLSDTTNLGSTLSKSYLKRVLDLVHTTDDVDGEVGADDDQNMHFVKSRSDLSLTSDSISFANQFFREYYDSTTAADIVRLDVDKLLIESINLGDVCVILLTTVKDFEEVSSVADIVSLDISKSLTDVSYFEDNAVKLNNKPISDGVSVGDSGLLFVQGYVDNLQYFAEDYVGLNQNF